MTEQELINQMSREGIPDPACKPWRNSPRFGISWWKRSPPGAPARACIPVDPVQDGRLDKSHQ